MINQGIGPLEVAPAKLNILGTMPSLSFGSPEGRQEIRLSMSMLQRNRIELLNIQMNNNSQTMNPGGHVMSRQEQELAACEPEVSPGGMLPGLFRMSLKTHTNRGMRWKK